MKLFLKLLVAALVIHGCFQGGRAAWTHYEFEDAIEQVTRFGDHKTTSELKRRVIALGEHRDFTIEPEKIRVEKRETQTRVALTYRQAIPLVPRFYEHHRNLTIDLTVSSVNPITVDDR